MRPVFSPHPAPALTLSSRCSARLVSLSVGLGLCSRSKVAIRKGGPLFSFAKNDVLPFALTNESQLTAALGGKVKTVEIDEDDDDAFFANARSMRSNRYANRRAPQGPGGGGGMVMAGRRQRRGPGGAVAGPPKLEATVYFPFAGKAAKPMKVSTFAESTGEQLINTIITQYNGEKREPPLKAVVAEAYLLRVAEDDGEPDEDIPPFDKARQVKSSGFDEFALCEDPKYRPPTPPPTPAGASGAEAAAAAPVAISAAVRRSKNGSILLRVHLPHGDSFMTRTQPGVLIKDLLVSLCRRKNFSAENYCIVKFEKRAVGLFDPGQSVRAGNAQMPTAFAEEMAVDSLPASDIMLLGLETLALKKKVYMDEPRVKDKAGEAGENGDGTGAPRPEDDEDDDVGAVYFNELTAMTYAEYEVIKIKMKKVKSIYKKYQNRRIMGIDGEKITNSLPVDSKNAFNRKGAKKAFRTISDVIDYGVYKEQPSAFYIRFKSPEGSSSTKDNFYKYEIPADSANLKVRGDSGVKRKPAHVAAEIIARIHFLHRKHRAGAKSSPTVANDSRQSTDTNASTSATVTGRPRTKTYAPAAYAPSVQRQGHM